jgi:DNA-directed RNA polymerase specialized sigma subunit
MNTASDRDLELWEKWRHSRSIPDMEALFKQIEPILRREIGRWTSIAPAFVLEAEAKKLALRAFENFDPNRGVKLSTYVTHWLQKLSRSAYSRQSTVSIPEHQRLTYNRYQRTVADLENELGHPPHMQHVADHMGLPLPKLQNILHNVARKEFLESGEGPAFQHYTDDDLVHLAYQDMLPLQKRIFELRTGYNGHPIQTGAQIQKTLAITQGQLSYELGKIKTHLEQMQRLR